MKHALRHVIAAAMLCLCLCSTGHAADKWTRKHVLFESIALASIGADWLQTRYIAEHPDKYKEMGCFGVLGRHPDKSNVDVYFAAWATAHVVVAHFLPADHRELWQIGTAYITLTTVADNAAIGIRLEW